MLVYLYRNADSPPAASQAAQSKPLPTHPKASITPHPGGLIRKAGRSPSDRPFVFCGFFGHFHEMYGEIPAALEVLSIVAEYLQFQITKNAYLNYTKCSESWASNFRDMHFCKLRGNRRMLEFFNWSKSLSIGFQ